MLSGYYQIPKERIQVKTHKKYQDLSKKRQKASKMPINHIEIFQRKRKTKRRKIITSDINIFLLMKNKGLLIIGNILKRRKTD